MVKKRSQTRSKTRSSVASVPAQTEDRVLLVDQDGLDAAVVRVKELKQRAVVCYWELGRAIYEIYESRLHTQRAAENGAPKYHSWTQFCRAELGMSSTQSYKLMDVATTFDRADLERAGLSKLALLVRLPPAERARMLDRVNEGTSLSGVAEQVRRLAAPTRVDRRGRKHGGGRQPGVEIPPSDGATHAMVAPASQRVLLDVTKSGGATTWTADAVHGGITEVFELVETPEGFVLYVERIRDGASEAGA